MINRFVPLVLLLVVVVSACSDSSPDSTTTGPAASGTEVSIVNFAFEPSTVSFIAGETITFVNNGTASHTTTAVDGLWDSGTLAPGESFDVTVTETGELPFFCSIHPSMEGTLNVS
jgi:plastocyanin